jgi:hypothetical protein
VHPRLRHQGCEPRHQIHWLEHDVGPAIPVGRLERVAQQSIKLGFDALNREINRTVPPTQGFTNDRQNA